MYAGDPRQLSPGTLAFVGDGVFELLVRERLLKKGSMPVGRLHDLAVRQVSASAQARAYPALQEVLGPEELEILRRGRNANTARAPKSCSPKDYREATAIEALFGYLYLKGETGRLQELYEVMASVTGGEE